MRNLRLIPVVLFATASLFVLKAIGILDAEGFAPEGPSVASAQSIAQPPAAGANRTPQSTPAPGAHRRSWAQEVLSYPDVTGSVSAEKPAAKPAEVAKPAKPPEAGKAAPAAQPATLAKLPDAKPLSAGERAVLDRLQARRKELDARGHQLEIREGLVKAAEKRIEARIDELKALEAQIKTAGQQRDAAEAARFKGVIAMYENMKPKDAARIFDRLDLKVLIDMASQIKPRTMSEILAQMSPEIAERLTVELAARPDSPMAGGLQSLPKIQGKPKA